MIHKINKAEKAATWKKDPGSKAITIFLDILKKIDHEKGLIEYLLVFAKCIRF